MSWLEKAKTSQGGPDEEIRTPDSFQILVGASEDLILLWQIAFDNWGIKSKESPGAWSVKAKDSPGSWDLKEKIVS